MERKNEIIDGIELSTWNEIEMIASTYKRPIRHINGIQSKIAILKFYLEPTFTNSKAPIETMDKGRMLTIAYQIYKAADGEATRELSLKVINRIIA
jgi:hypothetical protein